MKKIQLLLCLLFCHSILAQEIEKLYDAKKYQEIVELSAKTTNFTGLEYYLTGLAYFELQQDDKAVRYFDLAIEKGYDSSSLYLNRGISLRYLKKYDEAIESMNIAESGYTDFSPFWSERGMTYYYADHYELALKDFKQAIEFQDADAHSFYMVAHILHVLKRNEEALTEFNNCLKRFDKKDEYYAKSLRGMGMIEFTATKNYAKAVEIYEQLLELDDENYEYYPPLMKALNENKQYDKADKIFAKMQKAYEKNKLPEQEMEFKNAAVDEFEWQGQTIVVFRNFEKPKELLDISYKVYLFAPDGDKIERRFMVEKTLEMKKSLRHLLCEKDTKTKTHYTYLYGWMEDEIPLEDLKKAIILILEEKLKPGSSSKY